MNILITGANFENKGAQLMLVTLLNVLHQKFSTATVCVSPLLGDVSKLKTGKVKLLDFPLYHYGDTDHFPLYLNFPGLTKLYLISKGISVKGDIALRDIDLVFDISGFAFGDKWGKMPVQNLNLMVKKMKKLGARFILLPQAFGPFTDAEIRKEMKEVIIQADLVITRDKASYEHMADLVDGAHKHLLQYPDITLTQKVDKADLIPVSETPYCAIVPNERMLDKASKGWQEHYKKVLLKMVGSVLSNSDLDVVLLVHAQGLSKDAEIAEEIFRKAGKSNRIKIIQEDDPIRLKGIIAGASLLIGSRFHALASALSSNVPSIATSWLHKYEMLFEEYDQKEFSFKEPDKEIFIRLEELLNGEVRERIIDKLKESNIRIAQKNQEMWTLIERVSA